MKFLNSNTTHNVINVLIALIAALTAMDWTLFVGPEAAATAIAALAALKTAINIVRDGFTGLVKEQPPVE